MFLSAYPFHLVDEGLHNAHAPFKPYSDLNNLLGTATSFLAGGSETLSLDLAPASSCPIPPDLVLAPPTCGPLEPRPLRREGRLRLRNAAGGRSEDARRGGREGSEPRLLGASSPPDGFEVVGAPCSPPPPSKVKFATPPAGSPVLAAVPLGGVGRRQGLSASPGVGPWAPWMRRRWSGTPCSSRGWQCSATTKAATLRRCFTIR